MLPVYTVEEITSSSVVRYIPESIRKLVENLPVSNLPPLSTTYQTQLDFLNLPKVKT